MTYTPRAATVAALTDSTGAGAADGDVEAYGSMSLSIGADTIDKSELESRLLTLKGVGERNHKELLTKINEIRTSLRAVGLMA